MSRLLNWSMQWSGFVYVPCGFPWHIRVCVCMYVCMSEWGGYLRLIDSWGWSLRICASGAALWWFMYSFHSLNQKQLGKSPRCQVWWLSLLRDNQQTSNMFPTASLQSAAILAKKKKKEINQLSISACIISHHPDGLVNGETATS